MRLRSTCRQPPGARRVPPVETERMQLYLHCDGVLADFDAGVRALLGIGPKPFQARYGLSRFWRALARRPDFYADLPLMADARELFDGVRHLDPIVLTGLPRGDWAA